MPVKRAKPAKALPPTSAPKQSAQDQFEEALHRRDFSKAVSMLEFYKSTNQTFADLQVNPWLAYSAFHMGDYSKAADVYKEMLVQDDCEPVHWLHLACCHFGNGMYKESLEATKKGPSSNLKNRLLFHLANRLGDEAKVEDYRHMLQNTVEDQLSLAAMNYARNHYQEAIDIYKSIILQSPDFVALNVYIALCYYKMDFYENSLDVLNNYLQMHRDSATAINLKACNHHRYYNGKAAEQEIQVLVDLQSTSYNVENDIVKHNLVVFRSGEDAQRALPSLVDVIVPEARLNLVINHLKQDQVNEAYELVKSFEPITAQEMIVKAVVFSMVGQATDNSELMRQARETFQRVGASPAECDTIPGRQCMASCFFLLREYNDVLLYLNSIKPFFGSDDTFLYLYGITCASTGNYQEGEVSLSSIKNEKLRQEASFTTWLVRCYIMTNQPKRAWDMYLKMDTNTESFGVLQIIATDCYRVGSFYYAAKAFDVLERLDTSEDYVKGLRGSCAGVLQQVAAGKMSAESLWDVIRILDASGKAHQEAKRNQLAQQAQRMCEIMQSYAKDANISRRK